MAGRQQVRQQVRLAKGFMETAVIQDDADEFQIRNALSRSYYALFHACHGWLAMKNVPLSRRKHRQPLFEQIRNQRGKEFGERLEGFWLWRKRADYDDPEFFHGNLEEFRPRAQENQDLMKAEFESYVAETERLLEPS